MLIFAIGIDIEKCSSNIQSLLLNQLPSPDCFASSLCSCEMEILFLRKAIFFLAWQNDQRKFLQGLGKKDFMEKD
jgi:hypothetical protein